MSSPSHGDRHTVSPVQVARALGLSESTIKRWIDSNRLMAQRTAGGHRRILVSDVIELVGREKLPFPDPKALCATEPPRTLPIDRLEDALYEALQAGDACRTRGLILGAHQAGLPVSDLADQVISPVMARIGHGWVCGEWDVYEEHRATQLCLGALLALSTRIEAMNPVSEDRPLALGGGPEHDPYLLANLLLEMAFREIGWRSQNLGPNTPFDSLRRAMTDLRPRLVWLSCSHVADSESFLQDYEAFYASAKRAGVAVALGGRAISECMRRMTCTHFGDRIGSLTTFAGRLLACPSPASESGRTGRLPI